MKNNITKLKGYCYSIPEGMEACSEGKLLCARIETSYLCNMNCIYCAWDSGADQSCEIEYELLLRFITELKAQGAKSVIIVGGGEPTIYERFRDLVEFIDQLDLIPVVITNGLTMDRGLADFLYSHQASVLIKHDSDLQETQNFLSGNKHAYKKMYEGLKNLIDLGFAKELNTRLGISFVITKKNKKEIPDIWRFCRKNHIYPNPELLNPIGRAEINFDDLVLGENELEQLLETVNRIDLEEFHIDKKRVKQGENYCLQHLYSLYLNVDGYIQPCGAIRNSLTDFHNTTISEILKTREYQDIRSTQRHLDDTVQFTSYFG